MRLRNKVLLAIVFVVTVVMGVSIITKGFRTQPTGPITSNLPIMVVRMDSSTPIDADQINDETTALLDIIDNVNGINNFPYPYNPDVATQHYTIGMKLRGQSTRNCAKKPFGFKIYDEALLPGVLKKKDISMFGWPDQGKFVLYSSCVEGSLMRNVLAFEMARSFGRYITRTKYVELFIAPTNSTEVRYPEHYHGIYVLIERIHHGKDFVDIKKMDENDEFEPALTGGYMFKVDKEDMNPGSTDPFFYTPYAPQYIMIYPEDEAVTPKKKSYLYSQIVTFENAIMSPDWKFNGAHYSDLIDVISFVDQVIIQELTKNTDAYRLSSYFYKDRKKKVFSGPVWDLDRTWGEQLFDTDNIDGWMYDLQDGPIKDFWSIPRYWPKLMTDSNFTTTLKQRWADLRGSSWKTANVKTMANGFGDELTTYGATKREYNRWGPWYYPLMFWTTEPYWNRQSRIMREWLEDRLDWMDKAIPKLNPEDKKA